MPKNGSSEKKLSPPKLSFLLNANLSRNLILVLRKSSLHDFIHLSKIASVDIDDQSVINLAKRHKRIIITHDLDYGEIYFLKERGKIGVIMLRLSDQTSSNVIKYLTEFLDSVDYQKHDLTQSLIIISDTKIRIFSP